jgi:hypothetical protein
MDTSSATLTSYNFIVVFRELRLNDMLLTHARRLLPTLPNPLVTEIPNQLIGVVYPDHSIQCQFANRRVEVRHTSRSGLVGEAPFCDVAVAAVERARESGSRDTVAYGFNYDVLLGNYDKPGQYITARFLADPNLLAAIFGGSIEDAAVKITVGTSDCRVNFDLEGVPPDAPTVLKAHINYHFADPSPPNDASELCQLMQQKHGDFFRALQALPA